MSSSFGEYAIALEYKQAMQGIVSEVLDDERPAYRYAKVVSIDYLNSKCEVLYPGEPTTNVVNLNTTRPIEPGQYVRIEGRVGDKHVVDVQDGRQHGQGEFAFSEPFVDPDSAQDILAAMDAGVLSFTGQASGKTLMTMNEGSGQVSIPNLAQLANYTPSADGQKLIYDSYSSSAAAFNTGTSGEYLFGQVSFQPQPGHAYRYKVSVFYSGGTGTSYIVRVRANGSGGAVTTADGGFYVDSRSYASLGGYIELDVPLPRTWVAGTYSVAYSIQPSGVVMNRTVDANHPYAIQLVDEGLTP